MRKFAILIVISVFLFFPVAAAQSWWDTSFSYRISFNVSAGAYDRDNPVVVKEINFTNLLWSKTDYDQFDNNSIRLIDSSTESEVPYQFEQVSSYNESTNAVGNLTFVVPDTISSGSTEAYYVYFDSGSAKSNPSYTRNWGSVTPGSNIIENSLIRSKWEQVGSFGPGMTDFLIKSSSNDQCEQSVNQYARVDGFKPNAQNWAAVVQSTELEDGVVRKRMMTHYEGDGYFINENITLYRETRYLTIEVSHNATVLQSGFWGTPGGDYSGDSTDTILNDTVGSYDYWGVYDNVNGEGYELVVGRGDIDTDSWNEFESSGRYGFDLNMTASSLNYFVVAITSGSSDIAGWPNQLLNPVGIFLGSVENAPVCGDSYCDAAKGETESNCWSDCHVVVCGDGLCETGETASSCPTDCNIQIEFQQPAEFENFSRGDIIPIKVKLSNPKGLDIQDASVTAQINLPTPLSFILHDDGLHNDAFANDAIYGGQTSVSSSIPPGNYTVSVTASKWGNESTGGIDVNVRDELVTSFQATNDTYYMGYDIELSGSLKSMQNVKKTNTSLDIFFIKDAWSFHDTVQTDSNAEFEYTYPILFSDPDGTWTILINGTDEYNNTLETTLSVDVVTPTQVLYYYIQYSAPPTNTYTRGSEVKLSVYVRRGDALISEANVSYRDPSGNRRFMSEVSDGIYEDSFVISMDSPIGNWTLAVQATKYENDTLRAGASSSMTIEIEPMYFSYELIEPTRFQFTAGEVIDILLSVSFENGTPVSGAIVSTITPNGETLVFDEQDIPGYYKTTYTPTNAENGSWTMTILAQDSVGNLVTVDKRVLIRENIPLVPPWGWIVIISIILGVVVFWKIYGETEFFTWRYHRLKEEKDRIEMMKGIVEERYFNRQIDEDTYTKLMREHEEQSVGVISKLQEIQGKIKKKGKTKKETRPKKEKKKEIQKKQEKPKAKKETPNAEKETKKPEKKTEKGDSTGNFEEDFQRAKQQEEDLRKMQGL